MSAIPKLHLSEAEFKALPEYSCSLPTGTTAGKRWKRNHEYFTVEPEAHPSVGGGIEALAPRLVRVFRTKWLIGEYGAPEGDDVPITWYEPVVERPFLTAIDRARLGRAAFQSRKEESR